MLSENLLDDLMELILCRLPAKSLLRFKSVSKPWCQLIESPQFITKHYQTRAAISANRCLLIHEKRRGSFYLVDHQFPTWNRLEDLTKFKWGRLDVAHCNGIVCVAVGYNSIELWNPAIRQIKTLPESNYNPPPGYSKENRFLGLSFDPKSNGYKVVQVSMLWSYDGKRGQAVEVWTSGKNTWRRIEARVRRPRDKDTSRHFGCVPRMPVPRQQTPPINLNGKLYWLGRSLNRDLIVAFDIVHEVFWFATLPDAQCFINKPHLTTTMRLAILNESVALFSNLLEHDTNCFEIWVMNEEGNQVSWSKYMTVEVPPWRGPVTRSMKRVKRDAVPTSTKIFPLGFWNNKELIFRDECGKTVFLNMSTGKIVYSEVEICRYQAIYAYNESLVPINEWC